MKIAKNWKEAHDFIREVSIFPVPLPGQKKFPSAEVVGIDIGKQFGTRVICHVLPVVGHKLLTELEKRDLPLPQVFLLPNGKVLIGADPE